MELRTITKEELIKRFHEIEAMGWIENKSRKTNDGAAGNMLEDLLGIPENNLPIPNAAEWELKTHIDSSSSLVTLFHQEPSPTAVGVVAKYLLPVFGWKHIEAGLRYPLDERSFRATLQVGRHTRGFTLRLDDDDQKVCVDFEPSKVKEEDEVWLRSIDKAQITLTPYYGYNDLYCRAQTKLHNCFMVAVEKKRKAGKIYFHFYKALKLSNFSQTSFIEGLRQGDVYVDFDARTGHNHGTKIRVSSGRIPSLYEEAEVVMEKPKLK